MRPSPVLVPPCFLVLMLAEVLFRLEGGHGRSRFIRYLESGNATRSRSGSNVRIRPSLPKIALAPLPSAHSRNTQRGALNLKFSPVRVNPSRVGRKRGAARQSSGTSFEPSLLSTFGGTFQKTVPVDSNSSLNDLSPDENQPPLSTSLLNGSKLNDDHVDPKVGAHLFYPSNVTLCVSEYVLIFF